MDFRLLFRLIGEKLKDRTTYILALVVGTLINAYGQLLVPWFRGGDDPVVAFLTEFDFRPGLTVLSVFLAYAFPFCVGIYSAVAARYKNRRIESIADFPERKPDPVFRADFQGQLVEVGANTQALFARYHVDCTQKILGDELWSRIAGLTDLEDRPTIYFEPEDAEYLVAYAPTRNGEFNIYLTRLPRPKADERVPTDRPDRARNRRQRGRHTRPRSAAGQPVPRPTPTWPLAVDAGTPSR